MGLISVSTPLLLLSMVPILAIAIVSWKFDLKITSPIFVGTFRTFIQLSILGLILQPIFDWGEELWWVVIGYTFFMIVLAAYEASTRPKYFFKGMYSCVLVSIILNITLISLFAFGVIIKPEPLWNPQYVIPIVGMLLGNCISGVGLALNSILTAFVEQQREVELYLSFGATSFEASGGLIREAVRTGAMPLLNSMAMIGLVSIPGMMTGQILGGSPVMEAARYQMLIMYLISSCSMLTILTELRIALFIGFDKSSMLRNDRFTKRVDGVNIFARISSFCRSLKSAIFPSHVSADDTIPLTQNGNPPKSYVAPKGVLEVRNMKASAGTSEGKLEVVGIKRSFPVPGSDPSARRVLFQDISFEVAGGEIALVSGPSGVGKSQLLRAVAGLSPMDAGDVLLAGTSRRQYADPTEWRKNVRYVTQYKVDVRGTPLDFIQRVTSFQSWKKDKEAPLAEEMLATTRELVQNWGLEADCVEKEWTFLSGGEAQRVIVAVCLASRPRALLFDESTSSLDMESKLRVERTVGEFAEKLHISVLWITHDQEQAERMSDKTGGD